MNGKLASKKFILAAFAAVATTFLAAVMLFRDVEPSTTFWLGYFAVQGVYLGVQGMIDKKKVSNES